MFLKMKVQVLCHRDIHDCTYWTNNICFKSCKGHALVQIHWTNFTQAWYIIIRCHSWMKVIQVCSNRENHAFSSWEILQNQLWWKYMDDNSRTTCTWPILSKRSINYSFGKGIQCCSNSGPVFFQRKVKTKMKLYLIWPSTMSHGQYRLNLAQNIQILHSHGYCIGDQMSNFH